MSSFRNYLTTAVLLFFSVISLAAGGVSIYRVTRVEDLSSPDKVVEALLRMDPSSADVQTKRRLANHLENLYLLETDWGPVVSRLDPSSRARLGDNFEAVTKAWLTDKTKRYYARYYQLRHLSLEETALVMRKWQRIDVLPKPKSDEEKKPQNGLSALLGNAVPKNMGDLSLIALSWMKELPPEDKADAQRFWQELSGRILSGRMSSFGGMMMPDEKAGKKNAPPPPSPRPPQA